MKERPILMKGAMVRAILDGTKTQTRRIMKPQPETNSHGLLVWSRGGNGGQMSDENFRDLIPAHCPQGRPGDRLWVRETFADVGWPPTGPKYVYRADPDSGDNDVQKWKPSLFMPRAASRIALEVVSVQVERLNDISNDDAIDEGTQGVDFYAELWESINGPGSWALNPWVWVIEFKRIDQDGQ